MYDDIYGKQQSIDIFFFQYIVSYEMQQVEYT